MQTFVHGSVSSFASNIVRRHAQQLGLVFATTEWYEKLVDAPIDTVTINKAALTTASIDTVTINKVALTMAPIEVVTMA
jgi:hypothetical protein